MTPAETDRRSWTLVLVAVAVGSLLAHLVYLWPGGPATTFAGAVPLNRDEGTMLYESVRVLRGEVPYRDFFEFQGPLSLYFFAGVFAITGPSIAAARVVFLIIIAVDEACLAYVVGRLAGLRAGVFAAAVHALLIFPVYIGIYPHWLTEALIIGAMALLLARPARLWSHALAGVLLGLAGTANQSMGVPAAVAGIGCAAISAFHARAPRAWLRPAVLAAGVIGATLVVLAPLLADGALATMRYDMFTWTRVYYSATYGNEPFGWGVGSHFAHQKDLGIVFATVARVGIAVLLPMPFLAAAGGVVAAVKSLGGLIRRNLDESVMIAGGLSIATVATTILGVSRHDYVHLAYLGGFGLIGTAIVLGVVPRGRWVANRVFGALAVLAIVLFAGKLRAGWRDSRKMGTWREAILALPDAAIVDAKVAPGESVVVAPMGGLIYLYVRPSAIGQTLLPGVQSYLSPEQWRQTAGEIVARRPAVLVLAETQWKWLLAQRPELGSLYRQQPKTDLYWRVD